MLDDSFWGIAFMEDNKITFDSNDKLNRKSFAKNLTNIVLNSSEYTRNKSLVIALDSSWGTGKSMFIEMWRNQLNEDGVWTAIYNAWNNDDWNNPLISIVNDFVEEIGAVAELPEIENEIKKKAVKIFKYIGTSYAKKKFKDAFGDDVEDIVDLFNSEIASTIAATGANAEAIKKIAFKKKDTEIFNDFKKYKGLKKDFMNTLESLSSNGKIVFFIDELDRCRPTFAIETLEIIKHFFDIKNIVFVISLDMEQLSHSIATVYGERMDAEGYLRRFFDLNIKIPSPMTNEYVTYLNEVDNLQLSKDLKKRIIILFDKLHLTLRDMNSIFINIKILLNTSLKQCNEIDMKEVYIYLLILKYKYPKVYKAVLTKSIMQDVESQQNRKEDREYIESSIYNPSDNVYKFMGRICNGNTQNTIRKFFDNHQATENIKQIEANIDYGEKVSCAKNIITNASVGLFISPEDLAAHPEYFDMKIIDYIQRKLEIFNF